MRRARFLAAVLSLALAAPADALVTWEASGGWNFAGGGAGYSSDGDDPPVMVGSPTGEFSRGGALCPSPDTPDYLCATRFSAAGITGGRLWLKASATLKRKQAIGLGYGNSDALVYGDTTVTIYNLGNTASLATGYVYFVFGLGGTATTTKTSSEVQSQASGVATLSGIGIQCTGDPCPPIPIVVRWPSPVDFTSSHSFRLNLRADARAGAPVDFPYDAEMTANFADTLELLAIQVHDENDQPRPDVKAFLTDTMGNPMPPYDNTIPEVTTTTTLPDGVTTTTTLPGTGGCELGASYAGLACRLDALRALVGQFDLGKLAKPLLKTLNKATAALAKAEALADAPVKRRMKSITKATNAMAAFRRKLDAKGAVKKIDGATRATLQAPVAALLADLAGLATP
jgi:hypothetical protein